MAYLPDVAFDRSGELSHAAFRLYACFCKHRNNKTGHKFYGLSFPGCELISAETAINVCRVSTFTQALLNIGWIEKVGRKVRPIVGFEGELRESGWIPETLRQASITTAENLPEATISANLPQARFGSDNNSYETSETTGIPADSKVRYRTRNLPEATIPAGTENLPGANQNLPTANQNLPGANITNKGTSKGTKPSVDPADRPAPVLNLQLPGLEAGHGHVHEQQSEQEQLQQHEQEEKKAKRTFITEQAQEVFSYWREKCNHPGAILSDRRNKKLRLRLKEGFTVDQLKAAIDGCRGSPYHQGVNDDGTVYDDLELICRDPEHVERFIQIHERGDQQEEAERRADEKFKRDEEVLERYRRNRSIAAGD